MCCSCTHTCMHAPLRDCSSKLNIGTWLHERVPSAPVPSRVQHLVHVNKKNKRVRRMESKANPCTRHGGNNPPLFSLWWCSYESFSPNFVFAIIFAIAVEMTGTHLIKRFSLSENSSGSKRTHTNHILAGPAWTVGLGKSGLEPIFGHFNWCLAVISPQFHEKKIWLYLFFTTTCIKQTKHQINHKMNQSPREEKWVELEVFQIRPVCSGKIQTLQMQVILLCFLTIRQSDQEANVHLKRRGFDHKARPSFRNENLIDLCTAAPFTAAVFMGFSFSASLVNIIGLDSATFCSLVLSENNSSP